MRRIGNAKKDTAEDVFMSMMDNIDGMVKFIIEIEELEKREFECEDVYNYVMKNENGLVKIGISKDIDTRQNTLEHTSGYKIIDIFYTKPKRKALIVEAELHRYFSNYRKLGEWFYLEFDDAVEKTKELSSIDCEIEDEKNKSYEDHILDVLILIGKLGKSDEDILDYLVVSKTLKCGDINRIQKLAKLYAEKYIETGEEVFNLFTLYLLLKIKTDYKMDVVKFENGDELFISGYTACFYEKKTDFCECLDFYSSIYGK